MINSGVARRLAVLFVQVVVVLLAGCTTSREREESTGETRQAQVVISAPASSGVPTGAVGALGFGQSVLVPAGATTISALTLRVEPKTLAYRVQIFPWNNDDRVTGPAIYDSGPRVGANESATTLTGLSVPVTVGATYAIMFERDGVVPADEQLAYRLASSPYANGVAIAHLAAGDYTYYPTADLAFSVTFSQVPTSSTLTASKSSGVVGETLTFTSVVTTTNGDPPSGAVTFTRGATTLGTTTVTPTGGNAGRAELEVTLPVGTSTVTAAFAGTGVLDPSSDATTVTIAPATTTITQLLASPNPSLVDQEVTFSAEVGVVAPGGGTPTSGTVRFTIEGAVHDVSLTPASNVARLKHTFAAASTGAQFAVTARYLGDGTSYAASNNTPALTQVVNKLGTTLSFASPPPSTHVTYGSDQTFIGRVTTNETGAAATATTNTVSFMYTATGGTAQPLSSACKLTAGAGTDATGRHYVDASSAADCASRPQLVRTLPGLPPGSSYTITATYDTSDARHLGGTPVDLAPFIIDPQPATTVLVSNRASGSVVGEAVTFTATVSGAGAGVAQPRDSVTLFALSSAAPTTPIAGPTDLDAAHEARFTVSSLPVGAHNLSAVYSPTTATAAVTDYNYSAGAGATLTQTVNKAATVAVVITSSNPSVVGAPVTFTATVVAAAPGAAGGASDLTTGATLTFRDEGTVLGSGVLVAGKALWTLTPEQLPAGPHNITAVYSGNASFLGSTSAVIAQAVDAAGTTASITSSASEPMFGDSITFTARVASTTGSLPAGTVTFNDGTTTLGTVSLGSGGTASLTTNTLRGGLHAIVVVYDGDSNHRAGATASLAQTIVPRTTTTVLASSRNPSIVGESVLLTANVSSATGPVPAGAVTFKDGGLTLSRVAVNGGIATISLPLLVAGDHALTAIYAGDEDHAPSTGVLSQKVTRAKTTLTLTSSTNPSPLGSNVTFSALVKLAPPAVGTITGTVTFFDGASTLGSSTVGAGGVATFRTSGLTVGAHAVRATFVSFGAFEESSASVSQIVNDGATSITLSSAPNPSTFGAPVTLQATLAGPTSGDVVFTADGNNLGIAAIDGQGRAILTTTTLPIGTSSIVASYAGDFFFPAGTATAAHVVEKGRSAITLSASTASAPAGSAVSFTAQVTGATTGSIDFAADGVVLGRGSLAAGTSSFTTTTLGVGTHRITASFNGDATFLGSVSSPVEVVITSVPKATTPSTSPTNDGGSSSTPSTASTVPSDGCMQAPSSRSELGAIAIALATLLAVRRRRVSR